jgi:hypothetical protein
VSTGSDQAGQRTAPILTFRVAHNRMDRQLSRAWDANGFTQNAQSLT